MRHTKVVDMCLYVRERDVSFHDDTTRLVYLNIFTLVIILCMHNAVQYIV